MIFIHLIEISTLGPPVHGIPPGAQGPPPPQQLPPAPHVNPAFFQQPQQHQSGHHVGQGYGSQSSRVT